MRRITPSALRFSRWQISSKAAHSSGSSRMLVRPVSAVMLRLTSRLSGAGDFATMLPLVSCGRRWREMVKDGLRCDGFCA
jgi:hypothetical protein